MNEYTVKYCKNPKVIDELQKKLKEELPYTEYEDRHWWVVWKGKAPVGYAAIRIIKDFGWFSICGIIEKHRGHGLQKRLISARIKYAKKHGVKTLYTYTVNGNHPSATSLIRKKFLPCSPPEKHYGSWVGEKDILYWKLDLNE